LTGRHRRKRRKDKSWGREEKRSNGARKSRAPDQPGKKGKSGGVVSRGDKWRLPKQGRPQATGEKRGGIKGNVVGVKPKKSKYEGGNGNRL